MTVCVRMYACVRIYECVWVCLYAFAGACTRTCVLYINTSLVQHSPVSSTSSSYHINNTSELTSHMYTSFYGLTESIRMSYHKMTCFHECGCKRACVCARHTIRWWVSTQISVSVFVCVHTYVHVNPQSVSRLIKLLWISFLIVKINFSCSVFK